MLPTLAEMRHTAWALGDGAPSNIRAITQDATGYLWIGSSTGLYRFDGIRFERIIAENVDPARSLQITSLHASSDGSIWVGYDYGGFGVYRDGRLRDANPWKPAGGVAQIVETRDGAIWFAIESEGHLLLARNVNGKWTRFGTIDKPFNATMGYLLAARDGSLYVATKPNILRLRAGAKRFEPVASEALTYAVPAQDRKGRIWIGDPAGLRPLDDPKSVIRIPVNTEAHVRRALKVDRHGSFWITGQDQGFCALRLTSFHPTNHSATSSFSR